jgi:cell fate (sporulation/competence/biofilm development) regulator YmcA (YheA/YmcA/DUF963 family)
MNNIDELISSLKVELINEECVKEYFYYKNLLEHDASIKELDEQVRFHQKEMCRNKDNDGVYFKEKAIYENLKNKLDQNPILVNYQIAKEEVFSLLVDIKHILG